MSRALTKAERLLQLEVLLLSRSEGMRKGRVAARLAVDRSTAGRYVAERASALLSRRLSNTADSLDTHCFPPFTKRYQKVLETLVAASSENRTVRLQHLSRRRGETDEYRYQPYCVEPYPDGNSLDAVGVCPDLGKMRTFELERIRRDWLTDQFFEPPSDFDIDAYTSAAWGIWGRAGGKAQHVELLFAPAAAERPGFAGAARTWRFSSPRSSANISAKRCAG
jgi:hypothetical protein